MNILSNIKKMDFFTACSLATVGIGIYMLYDSYVSRLDIVQLIKKNGGSCYLTGNNLYQQLKNFVNDEKINDIYYSYDVIIKDMSMDKFQKILKVYNINNVKFYDFDTETNNYKRCILNINSEIYEFSIINDRKYTFNSIEYEINNLDEIDIDKTKIWSIFRTEYVNNIKDIKNNVIKLNNNSYIDDIHDVLRTFYYSSYYSLTIDSSFQELLKECCEDIRKIDKELNYELVLRELFKILPYCNSEIFKIMIDIGLFEALKIDFKNKENIVEEFNNIFTELVNYNKFIWFMSQITDESFSKIELIAERGIKESILFSREYDRNKENIKSSKDLLKFLTRINTGKNDTVRYYISLYYSDIEYSREILNYPISIHQIDMKGDIIRKYKQLSGKELKEKKREILEMIQDDKLKNNFENILTYIQTDGGFSINS